MGTKHILVRGETISDERCTLSLEGIAAIRKADGWQADYANPRVGVENVKLHCYLFVHYSNGIVITVDYDEQAKSRNRMFTKLQSLVRQRNPVGAVQATESKLLGYS
jgi:hypothetical protein